MSESFKHLYDNYLVKPGNTPKLYECMEYLSEYVSTNGWFNVEFEIQDEFLNYYPTWIKSSKYAKVHGLEEFPYRFVSLGVTQAMDWFHYECLRTNRRLRLFKGEYPYNRDVYKFSQKDFIDDSSLERGDAVLISMPFSGTGNKHSKYEEVLETCDKLDIPVMIDCAWFGACYDLEWHVNYDCVKLVGFSTSKGLQAGPYRAGICFSKWNYGPLQKQTEWKHGIHANVYTSMLLMKKYGPDYMIDVYKDHQQTVSTYFGLTPSKSIHIALGDENWGHFHRDKLYNRVNLRWALLDARNNKFPDYLKEKLP